MARTRLSLALALALALISTMATSSSSLALSHHSLADYTTSPFVRVTIRGLLNCSLPPDRPTQSPPIAGANVILQCGTNRATVADALTDPFGVFVIILENALATLFNSAQPCRAVVRLPIGACAVFPPTGTLEAPLTLVGVLLDPILGGLVGNFVAGRFQLP